MPLDHYHRDSVKDDETWLALLSAVEPSAVTSEHRLQLARAKREVFKRQLFEGSGDEDEQPRFNPAERSIANRICFKPDDIDDASALKSLHRS